MMTSWPWWRPAWPTATLCARAGHARWLTCEEEGNVGRVRGGLRRQLPVFGRHRKLVADPLLPATGAKPPVFGRRRKFPVKNGPFGVIFPTEKRGFGICVRQNPRSQLSQAKFHDTKHTVFGRNERACVKNSEFGAFNRRGSGEFHSLLPRSTPRGAVRPSLPAPLRSAPPPRSALPGPIPPLAMLWGAFSFQQLSSSRLIVEPLFLACTVLRTHAALSDPPSLVVTHCHKKLRQCLYCRNTL